MNKHTKNTAIFRGFISTTLLSIIFCCAATAAVAMDTLTENELASVEGRAGITLATGQTFDVARITFSKMYFSDPDGHPSETSAGYMVVSGDPNQIAFGLKLDQGGIMTLDSATSGASTVTIDGVTIPSRTTWFNIVVNAPVVGGEGRGMSLYLQTNDKLDLGISTGYTSTIPYKLGSLSVSNLFFGAVSDPNEPDNNDTKIMIWVGPEDPYP